MYTSFLEMRHNVNFNAVHCALAWDLALFCSSALFKGVGGFRYCPSCVCLLDFTHLPGLPFGRYGGLRSRPPLTMVNHKPSQETGTIEFASVRSKDQRHSLFCV